MGPEVNDMVLGVDDDGEYYGGSGDLLPVTGRSETLDVMKAIPHEGGRY